MNRGDIKLSEQLKMDHESGDFGNALKGYSERAATLETLGNKVIEQAAEIESLRISYDSACCLVAQLHEAVMGEIVGPHHGVVEDVRNKVAWLEATLASEQQDYKEVEAMLHAERDDSQTLRDKVTEQAALIEKYLYLMQQHIRFAKHGSGYIEEALATPTDSKQILADWMREQLGEPVCVFANVNALTPETGERWEHMVDDAHDGEDYIHLFKLPECLK